MGMKGLPPEKWGSVVANYAQLYGNAQDYTDQLRALEKARNAKPDDPAARFLLGYHYYYLGHNKEAFRESDKAIQLEPKDPFARTIRNLAAKKLGLPASEAPAGLNDSAGPPSPGGPPSLGGPPSPGGPALPNVPADGLQQ
jgi:tetratricopeptide (TPR) repeat protein